MAQDNTILRHFAAKISSSEVLLANEIRSWKENLFQWQPRYLEQSYWHSMFPLSVVKLPNTSECSQNSWQPSRDLVLVLCSLVSYILPLITQLSLLPLFLCLTSLTQCTMIDPPTFWWMEQERNKLFTRPFFPVWWKMVWGRDNLLAFRDFLSSNTLCIIIV